MQPKLTDIKVMNGNISRAPSSLRATLLPRQETKIDNSIPRIEFHRLRSHSTNDLMDAINRIDTEDILNSLVCFFFN